jgi:DNA-binding response OmpR family regulator
LVQKDKKDYNMPMRILVVEDDKKVARFLQKGLEEEHYAVDVCRDGNDALYHGQVNEYDVIILDIMLPGRDGITVCRELRRKGVITPVLMLTARDSVEDKVSGLSEGADDYLTKPFSFDELLARLRALMRRDQDYKTKTLKAGDLETWRWTPFNEVSSWPAKKSTSLEKSTRFWNTSCATRDGW